MDDLEASKAFIESNMDIVPSKMFLRAITAKKLSVQSKKDINEMNRIKVYTNLITNTNTNTNTTTTNTNITNTNPNPYY